MGIGKCVEAVPKLIYMRHKVSPKELVEAFF